MSADSSAGTRVAPRAAPTTIVFTQYFVHSDPVRRTEIDACMMSLCANPRITFVVSMQETTKNAHMAVFHALRPAGTKLVVTDLGRRLTFADVFREANRLNAALAPASRAPILMITCNADIMLPPKTIDLMHERLTPGTVWALSRWEATPQNQLIHFNSPLSQDTWAWKGELKFSPAHCAIEFGRGGCDNAIAERLERAGNVVTNPSGSVVTVHVHRIQTARNWTVGEVPGPYKEVPPTSL